MKLAVLLLTALSAFAANGHLSKDANYRFSGDRDYAGFCKAVVTNDVNLLRRSVRNKVGLVAPSSKDVLRKLISDDGMKCNGIDLIEFSRQREANEVYVYLTAQG